MIKIKSIYELYGFYKKQDCFEHEFNEMLLDMYTQHQITKEVFVEYLEITQGDVNECLEEIIG